MLISRSRFVASIVLLVALATVALGAKDKGEKKGGGDADENTNAVKLKDMKFSPATITVKPGTTVTWTNKDDHDHTVVATDESFKSGNLSHGETFEHKFEKKGKFKYACSYHPRMKGTVVVADE